jgi:Bacterial regulatory protein, arsR family
MAAHEPAMLQLKNSLATGAPPQRAESCRWRSARLRYRSSISRTLLPSSSTAKGLVITCMPEVLAEPHRRRIIELVGERERTAGEIVEAIGISQPGASQHLKMLRDAGLVTVRKDVDLFRGSRL